MNVDANFFLDGHPVGGRPIVAGWAASPVSWKRSFLQQQCWWRAQPGPSLNILLPVQPAGECRRGGHQWKGPWWWDPHDVRRMLKVQKEELTWQPRGTPLWWANMARSASYISRTSEHWFYTLLFSCFWGDSIACDVWFTLWLLCCDWTIAVLRKVVPTVNFRGNV